MSSSEIAGISPYDGKSIHYSLFTYRQQFVDVWIISAQPGWPGQVETKQALSLQAPQ
jgi:hypothetical protein